MSKSTSKVVNSKVTIKPEKSRKVFINFGETTYLSYRAFKGGWVSFAINDQKNRIMMGPRYYRVGEIAFSIPSKIYGQDSQPSVLGLMKSMNDAHLIVAPIGIGSSTYDGVPVYVPKSDKRVLELKEAIDSRRESIIVAIESISRIIERETNPNGFTYSKKYDCAYIVTLALEWYARVPTSTPNEVIDAVLGHLAIIATTPNKIPGIIENLAKFFNGLSNADLKAILEVIGTANNDGSPKLKDFLELSPYKGSFINGFIKYFSVSKNISTLYGAQFSDLIGAIRSDRVNNSCYYADSANIYDVIRLTQVIKALKPSSKIVATDLIGPVSSVDVRKAVNRFSGPSTAEIPCDKIAKSHIGPFIIALGSVIGQKKAWTLFLEVYTFAKSREEKTTPWVKGYFSVFCVISEYFSTYMDHKDIPPSWIVPGIIEKCKNK